MEPSQQTDTMKNGKPTAKLDAKYICFPRYFRPILVTAVIYAILLFFFVVVSGSEPQFVLVMGIFAIVSSVALLTSAWSVFGPGWYLYRLVWAHIFAAIPAFGGIIGLMMWVAFDFVRDAEIMFLLPTLISVIPVSIGSQLFFWILRGFFGWQIVGENNSINRRFVLKDIFALTFVIALGFAVPQFTTSSFDFDGAYYDVESENEDLSSEERAQLQKQEEQRRQAMARSIALSVYGSQAIGAFIATMICSPILFFVLRSKEGTIGCFLSVGYLFGLQSALIVVISIISGAPGGSVGEGLVYLSILNFMFVASCTVPLLILRENGIRLVKEVAGKEVIRDKKQEKEAASVNRTDNQSAKQVPPNTDTLANE
ncbi:MAG: hypothetical protein AAF623_15650 [Planctomycetota bacterium]